MDMKGQVIEKDDEEHFEGWLKKDLLTGHFLSEWATKDLRGAEYACGGPWVDLGPVDVIIVRAEAVKQVSRISWQQRATPTSRQMVP